MSIPTPIPSPKTNPKKATDDLLSNAADLLGDVASVEQRIALAQAIATARIADSLAEIYEHGLDVSTRENVAVSIPETLRVSIAETITVSSR